MSLLNLTDDKRMALAGLGLGLSQLDAGQPVNLSQPMAAMMDRRQRADQKRALEESGVLNQFTPQQRAILAQMPPQAAQQVISSVLFAPKPKKPNLQTVSGPDGTVYSFDPASGGITPLTGAKPEESVVLVGPNDPNRSKYGLPADGKTYEVKLKGDAVTDYSVPGGAGVSIDMGKAETAYDQERGKSFAERMNAYDADVSSATRALSSIDAMEGAMDDPNFYSGAGAGAVKNLRKWATALGIDAGSVDSMEAFNSQAKAAALEAMGGSLGAGFSDADRSFVLDQVPQLENTPEGNALIMKIQRALNERRKEIALLAQKYERDNGRLDYGFDVELEKFVNENPLFTEGFFAEEAAAAPAPVQPPASPVPNLTDYNVKTMTDDEVADLYKKLFPDG